MKGDAEETEKGQRGKDKPSPNKLVVNLDHMKSHDK